MKILLSAYACEPNKGSEPGVGWNWAREIAHLGHDVWVITRANNQSTIEAEHDISSQPPNLHFIYYDVPKWARWWKKGQRGIHLYYLFWQIGAYLKSKKLHKSIEFDLVQHITFVSIRQPSFMGNLGIPFIFGPVAGGDKAPIRLRQGYGIRGWFTSLIRDFANSLIRFDPLMLWTFSKADKILVTSPQTQRLLPKRYIKKSDILIAIGIDESWTNEQSAENPDKNEIRILYVGNLLYLKGMHLGIPALKKAQKHVPNLALTIVGSGPDEQNWRKIAKQHNIEDSIKWIPRVQQSRLQNIYDENDLFLFPSLQDSGGTVVLEAMARGLPVICFDIGGPGAIVNKRCGSVLKTSRKSELDVIEDLSEEIIRIASNQSCYTKLSSGAKLRSKEFKWSSPVNKIYNELNGEKESSHL